MKAKEFFSNYINDNQNIPLYVSEYIELHEDFYCNTNNKTKKELKRQHAISCFLKDVRKELENIDISRFDITWLVRDNEFDFNQDDTIVNITGDLFSDIKISTFNIVGSINWKGEQLNINCRFGNQFLAYMIANTSGFIELENFGNISNQKGLGEWILLLYWKNCLKKAFSQGIYKTYEKKSDELTTVRGSININSWLKKQYFDGKINCEFKEHSYDNNINKVISLALRKVSKSLYSDMLFDIIEIKRTFEGISYSDKSFNYNENVVTNSYYKNYNLVFDLSKRILQNQFMNFSGSDQQFSAFLFDISLLFEHHIRKILKKYFVLKPKELFEFKVPNGISDNKLFPDIIIDYGNNEIGVFDVKYKHFQTTGKSPGVKRDDRFQLISYIAYYSNRYKVVNSGFIFPCEENQIKEKNNYINQSQEININGMNIPFRIHLYTVNKNIQEQSETDQRFIKSFVNDTTPKTNVLIEL